MLRLDTPVAEALVERVRLTAAPPAITSTRRTTRSHPDMDPQIDPDHRCPPCGDAMRIVAFLTAPPVIDQILAYLRRSAQRLPPPLPPAVGEPPRARG